MVDGTRKLIAQMTKFAKAAREDDHRDAIVSYSAPYAVPVHENRQAYHKRGRAGYLLDVARENMDLLGRTVVKAVKSGKSVQQARLLAAMLLMRLSQRECPVKTGRLRRSARAYLT